MNRSDKLYLEAQKTMPGGVNSPVRSFKGMGISPEFITEGRGCHITSEDGHQYIDYIGAYGPLILGHCHPRVIAAIREASLKGTAYGTPTALEVRMAEKITSFISSMEMVRMVNSGTEATLSAIRLARAITGRDSIIKFNGCYHGHGDSFLIKAGSGALTLGVPDSPGVPPALAELTFVANFNDLESVREIFNSAPNSVAAVIIEPVAGNMGVIPPEDSFLQSLRKLTTDFGALLIFDEVMTGFRVCRGGAQDLYGVEPDLTTLGKVIGGGLPVGAYGGSRELMKQIAPAGPVYQAGTLSGNPLALAAGLTQLEVMDEKDGWTLLEENSKRFAEQITNLIQEMNLPITLNRVGSMLTLFFAEGPIRDFSTATRSDTNRYALFFRSMLTEGIHLPPSQFEALFISLAHEVDDFEQTLEALRKSFRLAFETHL